ncbi:hypothetical protein IE53DRAFT_67503 [Violaceomyces palustris]|uniref:Uncharacterized protein n=1 Tax=Violaceomyces palustris TaxID=1673888 RepID=A0ACD0NZ01_9BASI|nr:hypothetical protein IE53DRAFT_67503 [Violaceomyces palustris]
MVAGAERTPLLVLALLGFDPSSLSPPPPFTHLNASIKALDSPPPLHPPQLVGTRPKVVPLISKGSQRLSIAQTRL